MSDHDTIERMQRLIVSLFFVFMLLPFHPVVLSAQNKPERPHIIQPGDTWTALSFRLGVSKTSLLKAEGAVNPQLQPTMGSSISLGGYNRLNGRLLRPIAGGLLETAALQDRSTWEIALQNNLKHPYAPLLYKPVFLPGGSNPPLELPFGFEALSIFNLPAKPGQALALQAQSLPEMEAQISLDSEKWATHRNGDRILGLGATGAFFGAERPELRIQVDQHPLWVQPWLFEDGEWFFDQVSFTATAANEQEAIQMERERLQQIWGQVTSEPLWTSAFTLPLQNYVEISSHYGARRSVNGGPYDTYHEGTDFSAYGGTPVYAPASGRVVLAEPLIVRGDAVILDHGLGIHSGYYHLSSINVHSGDEVLAGDLLGEVGTTGRSTGNHLHWDLLIGTTWVDAEEWIDSNLSAWTLNAWGGPFPNLDRSDMPPNP